MKKQSRTVRRRRQSTSPSPRHLPLVEILIDTQGISRPDVRSCWFNSTRPSSRALCEPPRCGLVGYKGHA